MRRRPLLVAKCKAFYLLAGTGAEQQGLRRQNALVPNAPIRRPSGGTSAPCGRDRHGPEDRSSVLQCCAIRNGLCRSRGLVLRDALPDASGQQFASACQGIRLCSPALGAESRCCRFLGSVLQRQPPDLGMQRLHIDRRRGRRSAVRSKNSGSAILQLRLPRRDLIGVDVELLGKLSYRPVALDGGTIIPSCKTT